MKKIAAVMVFLGAATACVFTPAAFAAEGAALYEKHCAKCHGDNGEADSFRGYLYFARNFANKQWQASHSDTYILERINSGPRIMPAYKDTLTQEEREDLVRVIRGFAPAK